MFITNRKEKKITHKKHQPTNQTNHQTNKQKKPRESKKRVSVLVKERKHFRHLHTCNYHIFSWWCFGLLVAGDGHLSQPEIPADASSPNTVVHSFKLWCWHPSEACSGITHFTSNKLPLLSAASTQEVGSMPLRDLLAATSAWTAT